VTVNPFVHLFEAPVESLTALAYALVLVAVLVATWWAGGRNALWLYQEWREGWYLLVPGRYAARVVAMVLVVALDLLLVAGIVGVLT
jgi:hypothetical protein